MASFVRVFFATGCAMAAYATPMTTYATPMAAYATTPRTIDDSARCDLYNNDVAFYSAKFETHSHHFDNNQLDDLISGYHPDAVIQLPQSGATICGKAKIREYFAAVFRTHLFGSTRMIKNETVCPTAATACVSYKFYTLGNNSEQGTDTFVWNPHGEIVYQTFNSGSPSVAGLDDVLPGAEAECALYKRNTAIFEASLERHLDAFGNAKVEAIMADYHPEAVLQVPDSTICGMAAIRKFFVDFYAAKPAGSPINMMKKETVCPTAAPCASFISYNMSSTHINFPMATDTFVYNSQGQIVSQTFAGINTLA